MHCVNVKQACYTDLAPLSAALGHADYFAERFERQKNGRGVLFVAVLDDRPVGDVYLWLEPAEEPEIRRFLPDAALLTHLEVLAPFRCGGIGSCLIREVETYVRDGGQHRVALAVRLDNPAAARLYRRHGYADWGHGELTCFTFRAPEIEHCHVMVKDLSDISSDNCSY